MILCDIHWYSICEVFCVWETIILMAYCLSDDEDDDVWAMQRNSLRGYIIDPGNAGVTYYAPVTSVDPPFCPRLIIRYSHVIWLTERNDLTSQSYVFSLMKWPDVCLLADKWQ